MSSACTSDLNKEGSMGFPKSTIQCNSLKWSILLGTSDHVFYLKLLTPRAVSDNLDSHLMSCLLDSLSMYDFFLSQANSISSHMHKNITSCCFSSSSLGHKNILPPKNQTKSPKLFLTNFITPLLAKGRYESEYHKLEHI